MNINENDILDFHLNFNNHKGPSTFTYGVVEGHNLNFLALAFSSLQAFLCAEPKKQMNVFCALYDKDDLIPDLSPSIFISREYFVLILTKNICKSYLVFVLKVLNLILISHLIYWGDIIFLLYNEHNKGNKNGLNID